MPSRHGAILQGKDGPQCKLGIQQIFDPWIAPELLLAQGHNIRHPEGRPLDIHLHFRRVVIRLLLSLGRFYQGARQYDQFLEAGALAGPNPGLVFEIPEAAGIAADSIFHYLTLFIDDLARMIPFVLIEDGDERQEPDGFNAVKWHGHRDASTAYALHWIGGQVEGIELEDALQNLLSGLCEWLDQLDQELLSHLAERLERQGVHWEPFNDAVPVFRLPGPGEAPLDASHYLYLPICGEAPPATDDSTTTER